MLLRSINLSSFLKSSYDVFYFASWIRSKIHFCYIKNEDRLKSYIYDDVISNFSDKRKCEFFQADAVSITLYGSNTYQMLEEKVRCELNKSACFFKQILEAALYKTAAVLPLTKHLINYPRKISKTYLANKLELISNVLLWTPTYGHTRVG